MQELLTVANELRRSTKRCVFVHNEEVSYYAAIGEVKALPTPHKKSIRKVKSFHDETKERLDTFDAYRPELESTTGVPGTITQLDILRLADTIARLFVMGDVFYHKGALYIEGCGYRGLHEIMDVLPTLRNPNALSLYELVKMSSFAIYMQHNNSALLDGLAYVAKSYEYYKDRPLHELEDAVFEGYLHNGILQWVTADKEAFKEVTTKDEKSILVLSKVKPLIDSVVRGELVKGKNVKYKKYPYPIAYLEDGEESYLAVLRGD